MSVIKKVLANVAQSLTDAEKLQARKNAGAGKVFVVTVFLYEGTYTADVSSTDIFLAINRGDTVYVKAVMSIDGTAYFLPMTSKGDGPGHEPYVWSGIVNTTTALEVELGTYMADRWSYNWISVAGQGQSRVQLSGVSPTSTGTFALTATKLGNGPNPSSNPLTQGRWQVHLHVRASFGSTSTGGSADTVGYCGYKFSVSGQDSNNGDVLTVPVGPGPATTRQLVGNVTFRCDVSGKTDTINLIVSDWFEYATAGTTLAMTIENGYAEKLDD